MGLVSKYWNLEQVGPMPQRWKFLTIFLRNVFDILNKGIIPADNFDAAEISIVFGSSGSDVTIAHSLGRIPSGYWVIKRTAGFVVYDGSKEWTESEITLRATALGSATILVF